MRKRKSSLVDVTHHHSYVNERRAGGMFAAAHHYLHLIVHERIPVAVGEYRRRCHHSHLIVHPPFQFRILERHVAVETSMERLQAKDEPYS